MKEKKDAEGIKVCGLKGRKDGAVPMEAGKEAGGTLNWVDSISPAKLMSTWNLKM